MKDKFILVVDIIENKKKIFAHIKKKKNVTVTEEEVRNKLDRENIEAGLLKIETEQLFVFDFVEKQQVQKVRPTRKTTTRKPRARRKTATTKKQTEN